MTQAKKAVGIAVLPVHMSMAPHNHHVRSANVMLKNMATTATNNIHVSAVRAGLLVVRMGASNDTIQLPTVQTRRSQKSNT
jgi:hypothetical protein